MFRFILEILPIPAIPRPARMKNIAILVEAEILALVMIGILPMCISWVGKPGIVQGENHLQKEEIEGDEQLLEVEEFTQAPKRMDDDIVELMD